MRLDKFLSQQLGISRNLVGRELRAGRVTVNGDIVKSGSEKFSRMTRWPMTETCYSS